MRRTVEHRPPGKVKFIVQGVTDLAAAELAFSSSNNKSEGHEVVATNQFVFAYRLREIKYDKKLKKKPYDQEVIRFHGLELAETGPCHSRCRCRWSLSPGTALPSALGTRLSLADHSGAVTTS